MTIEQLASDSLPDNPFLIELNPKEDLTMYELNDEAKEELGKRLDQVKDELLGKNIREANSIDDAFAQVKQELFNLSHFPTTTGAKKIIDQILSGYTELAQNKSWPLALKYGVLFALHEARADLKLFNAY